MPKKSLIENETTRAAVIAAVMLAILIAALLAAWPLTFARATAVGDLRLKLPRGWHRQDLNDPQLDGEAYARFAVPGSYGGELEIVALQLSEPTHPARVLLEYLRVHRGAQHLPQPKRYKTRAMSTGDLAGVRFAGWSRDDPQQPYIVTLHTIAVLTTDARRFWVLYLSELAIDQSGGSVPAFLPFDDGAFDALCDSLQLQRLSPADDADLADAKLAFTPPATLRAVVDRDRQPGDPIDLLPAEGPAGFEVMRVLGTIDTGVDDAAAPLSPARLLARRFERIRDRLPEPQEQWQGKVQNAPAWSLSISAGSEAELARKLWYVRLAAGRGVLIDVLADQALVSTADAQVPAVVDALLAGLTNAAPQPNAMSDALARGQALAQWHRDHLAEHQKPHTIYWLVERGRTTIGFQQDRAAAAADGAMPITGQTLSVLGTADIASSTAVYDWSSSAQATRYTIRFRQMTARRGPSIAPDSPAAPPRSEIDANTKADANANGNTNTHANAPPSAGAADVEGYDAGLQDGQLTMTDLDGRHWSAAAPEALVPPMAEDYWPADGVYNAGGDAGATGHGDRSGAALLWLAMGRYEPAPYWAQFADDDAGRTELRLRPLMAMDADRLTLDASGTVRRHLWLDVRGSPAGPTRYVIRRVGIADVSKAFPRYQQMLADIPQPQASPGNSPP